MRSMFILATLVVLAAGPASAAGKPRAAQGDAVPVTVPVVVPVGWTGVGSAPVMVAGLPPAAMVAASAFAPTPQVVPVPYAPAVATFATPAVAVGGTVPLAGPGLMVGAPVVSVAARQVPAGVLWQPQGIGAYPGLSSTFVVGGPVSAHTVSVAPPVLATAPVANPFMIRQ